ncbi:MAG: site-specific integrase [Chitinophagales bacterium]
MASLKLRTRNNKMNNEGKVPIVLQIIHNRKVKEISLKKYIDPKHWDSKNCKLNKKHHNPSPINAYLANELRAYESIINRKLALDERFEIKDIIEEKNGMLTDHDLAKLPFVEFLRKYIEENPDKRGINTLRNYKSTLTRFTEFDSKIKLQDINFETLKEFESFLNEKYKSKKNTIHGRMKIIKKFCRMARAEGIIKLNPFDKYQIKSEDGDKPNLTLDEVKRLDELIVESESDKLIKDVFIFCCYTGLRFSDICTLAKKDIIEGDKKGTLKINIHLHKTSKMFTLQLAERAKEKMFDWGFKEKTKDFYIFPIIESYNFSNDDQLKRIISSKNVVFNKKLKELAKKASIDKVLTFHMSRHSFATIGLTLGIRMEVLRDLLGHSDLKTTQVYAKVVDKLKNEAIEL